MSKKKNTLKDLDDFLKQQAASLVTPAKLPQDTSTPSDKPSESADAPQSQAGKKLDKEQLLQYLKSFAGDHPDFRMQLYDVLIRLLESQHPQEPEDKMIINTALYLKNGERWKEAISEYWKGRE